MALGSGSYNQQFAQAPGASSIYLSCGTTTGTTGVAIPACGTQYTDVEITNSNSSNIPAWITFADSSTLTAAIPTNGTPANGYIILAGQTKVVSVGVSQTLYVAGITASSTAILYLTVGKGA